MNRFNFSSKFKRDLKKLQIELSLLPEWIEVANCLLNNKQMAKKYCDHDLKHDWNGFRECHILPDLLLIYKQKDDIIHLVRIGSHSELFG
ncbi:MAG: type II toxin-antitoxin system YafQ family toxin [Neisseriaceae bacterium]|nr:type II toxin-antitoxin system YafQ family toxin [Neisseriaceae bacterium]MBQ1837386.1 type II toxin-antitoxin system YafQ family toxin [Neisseriaceae bacterium]MBR3482283.1 type II toxin-antitoxin system YafQ family toxin [Neisseriaceae bacterium]